MWLLVPMALGSMKKKKRQITKDEKLYIKNYKPPLGVCKDQNKWTSTSWSWVSRLMTIQSYVTTFPFLKQDPRGGSVPQRLQSVVPGLLAHFWAHAWWGRVSECGEHQLEWRTLPNAHRRQKVGRGGKNAPPPPWLLPPAGPHHSYPHFSVLMHWWLSVLMHWWLRALRTHLQSLSAAPSLPRGLSGEVHFRSKSQQDGQIELQYLLLL